MPIERLLCLLLGGAMVVRLLTTGITAGLPAAHAGVYALACVLFLIGTGGRAPLGIAAALAAVGALGELQQALRPGGHANALDFVAGACGAFAAATLMSLKLRKDRLCAESSEL